MSSFGYPWMEEEMIAAHAKKGKKLPAYPADHKVGIRVPKGGSDCAKCEYVRQNGKACANKSFVQWNGSNMLPAPADEYCCDFFSTK